MSASHEVITPVTLPIGGHIKEQANILNTWLDEQPFLTSQPANADPSIQIFFGKADDGTFIRAARQEFTDVTHEKTQVLDIMYIGASGAKLVHVATIDAPGALAASTSNRNVLITAEVSSDEAEIQEFGSTPAGDTQATYTHTAFGKDKTTQIKVHYKGADLHASHAEEYEGELSDNPTPFSRLTQTTTDPFNTSKDTYKAARAYVRLLKDVHPKRGTRRRYNLPQDLPESAINFPKNLTLPRL